MDHCGAESPQHETKTYNGPYNPFTKRSFSSEYWGTQLQDNDNNFDVEWIEIILRLVWPNWNQFGGREASIQAFDQSPLFLDRDQDLFVDILFFMRSNRLPASTRRNVGRLEDLQAEATFFVYDALQPCSNKPVHSSKFCCSGILNCCRLIGACMKRSDVVTTTT
jgi:hypothetical protein